MAALEKDLHRARASTLDWDAQARRAIRIARSAQSPAKRTALYNERFKPCIERLEAIERVANKAEELARKQQELPYETSRLTARFEQVRKHAAFHHGCLWEVGVCVGDNTIEQRLKSHQLPAHVMQQPLVFIPKA